MVRNKRGQFILIASLLIALMIISVSAIMYSAVTYYRHERWEEYLVVIDGVKAGTTNSLTVSLANYTQTSNGNILKTNLDQWREDVKKAYAGYGVMLGYSLASGVYSAYGMNLNYNLGLASTWNQPISFSAANATASLNITSVGLTGYRFTSAVFLKMNITDALWYPPEKKNDPGRVGVRAVVYAEGPSPVTNLRKANFVLFQIGGVNQSFSLFHYYESNGHGDNPPLNAFVYELRYFATLKPSSVMATVGVVDTQSIKVIGQATLTTIDA